MSSAQVNNFIFDHVFLPPSLPQSDDNELGAETILKNVTESAFAFAKLLGDPAARRVWTGLAHSTSQWIDLHDGGTPCSYKITECFKFMSADAVLMVYVQAQNATIVVRNRSTGAIFECFEVMPTTDAVMKAKDALLRSFPARAIFLPRELLQDHDFLEELGTAIHKLSIEPIKQAMETTTKASNTITEIRQTPSPKMVTEWLFGAFLGGYGKATSSPTICKRTIDDVLWKNADKPWRRSGIWLSIKVTLQLALINSDLDDTGAAHYKNFLLFLLARFSTQIMSAKSDPDTLHVLRAKLARRNAKLGSRTLPFVQNLIQGTLQGIDQAMRRQWKEVTDRDNVLLPVVPEKEIHHRLTLRHSGDHLRKIWDRSRNGFKYSQATFEPPISARVSLKPSRLPPPSFFTGADDSLFGLRDFEYWIETNLRDWISENASRSSACRDLYEIMQAYHRVAINKYDRHPERMSCMLLIIFELWMALDHIAARLHPLLSRYAPEVPTHVFEPLLLDKKSDLERLLRVELHIKSRLSNSNPTLPSMFTDPSEQCFAVNFFDQSPKMQQLKCTIEAHATKTRDGKTREWETKKLEYESYLRRANAMECGIYVPRGFDRYGIPYVGRPRHDKKCQKCNLEKAANQIQIEKHEWPLPESSVMSKAVVFELKAPEEINCWRDATWFVVHCLGRSDIQGRECKQVLLNYAPLANFVENKDRRITLASSVKPMINAHYFKGGINIDAIFVKNGLVPRLKDTCRNLVWTEEQESGVVSLHRHCKSTWSQSAPEHLIRFVNSTTHTHNSVLALHSKCPSEMGPHEHVLFGTLRSGEKLQFINILTTVMSSEADINSPATVVLISNAISQVGRRDPSRISSCLRDSHLDLLEKSFCDSLLLAIEIRFSKIEANWKEANAASVLLAISLKVLSLSPIVVLEQRCLAIASRIRQAAINWVRQLAALHSQERASSNSSTGLADISRQIMSCCMLIRNTFDVDGDRQPLYFNDQSAVLDYVEASILLHDHKEHASGQKDIKYCHDLLTDSYRARQFESHILTLLQEHNSWISDGIKRVWETASFTGVWRIVHQNDTSWVQNYATNKVVHYNIVTGSLLVSGRSLSRLSSSYTSNKLYQSFFGSLDLDVSVSNDDDMEYMTRAPFQGHVVHFGLRKSTLLIRSHFDGHKYEAISRDIFRGDLPRSIVDNSLPWMNLQDGQVCFRRPERAWSPQADDWILTSHLNSQSTRSMYSSLGDLVDAQSSVGVAVSTIFKKFETSENLLIYKSKEKTTGIQIKLPRYHLNFSVQFNGDVKCKELSAIVDRDQSLNTLHGLKNFLVLRVVNKAHDKIARTVLIPNGDVEVTAAYPHVQVQIQLGKSETLSFSQYRLDKRLGQLVSGDLEGHLFKTYLHALTSFPERDEFTSRTGTEEALFGLSDPVTRTSLPLSARAQKLLHSLADLSPKCKHYPPHLKTMHTDTFNKSLPVLSQRDIFFGTVASIVEHNLKASFLFEGSSAELPSYAGDFDLLDRSHRRSRKLFANESVADIPSTLQDYKYASRDRVSSPAQGAAFSICKLVTVGPSEFDVDPNIAELMEDWVAISGFNEEFVVLSLSTLLDKPLKEQWPSLLPFCKSFPSKHKLALVFSLMAYGDPKVVPQLRTLFAFSVEASLRALPSPEHNCYDIRQGYVVSRKEIEAIITLCKKSITSQDEGDSSSSETSTEQAEYETQSQRIRDAVYSSWPDSKVNLPRKRQVSHFDYAKLRELLDGRFAVWHKNHVFMSLCRKYDQHLKAFSRPPWLAPQNIETILNQKVVYRDTTMTTTQPSLLSIMRSVNVTEADFDESQPTLLDRNLRYVIPERIRPKLLDANQQRVAWEEIEDIVDDLQGDTAPIIREYGHFIDQSLKAHKETVATLNEQKIKPPNSEFLKQQTVAVQNRLNYILRRAQQILSPRGDTEQGLVAARLWPAVSELALLQLLSAEHRSQLPVSWKKVILGFAEEITALQRVERMQKYVAASDNFALAKELENPAHAEWSTEEWPDWLLLEIQNQILIRPVQIRIALELIKAESGVVLADMGIGKSSTILPMVVTALATGTSLVRVVVLKPLANEMLRILSRSLSGLVGRAVYFLPISRQTNLTSGTIQRLLDIYQSCNSYGGVLVSLPEHLNSFRLLCSDKLTSDPDLGQDLFRVQQWLDQNARDVMDETDQLLEPAYELVYTTGESLLLSNSPERWNISLELLALVRKNAIEALKTCPSGLEIESRGADAFDHIRILSDAGCQALTALLVEDVLQSKLPSVPLGHCNGEVVKALSSFLQDTDVCQADAELILTHFEGSGQLNSLYLIRGLISSQILSHTLRKRWLVNYGLDRNRHGGCLAAVPYRAKAIPSQSAEFAQPETMIILTALSYYYTGLQYQDLRECILMLLRSPDPSEEFAKWVRNSKLPTIYRTASSINLDEALCVDVLFHHLCFNQSVIDFFLRFKVFPKEGREFSYKLSSSAWDLCASDSGKIATGFSGTCDSRIPSTIKQKDLKDLRHSTASTLGTILKLENRNYICAKSHSGQRLATEELLDLIVAQQRQHSVIIDVGAQFLEDNKEIAFKWLSKCKSKMAAIYFSDNDEKMVINRDGTIEKFNSSIFKDDIGSCIIYLDEFHTRGTDFQLPDDFLAAVLLGPRLAKDTLVQACMRMRKLAVSQSVIFIAPPEVDQSIRAAMKNPSENIDSCQVLRWSIFQSCSTLKHQHPLWVTRGIFHSRRRIAAAQHISDSGRVTDVKTYLSKIRERESRPVSEMYRENRDKENELPVELSPQERADSIMKDLLVERNRTDVGDFRDSGISEEQEREVLHEVEQEREVQRPREVRPAVPKACEALLSLIRDGILPDRAEGLRPAFEVLTKTRLAAHYTRASWPMQILVTDDFVETIIAEGNSPQDDFLRPVQWVLKTKRIKQPIIISPHEANMFLPAIRASKRATLFLYQARTSKGMAPFDKLDVYKVPEADHGITISREQTAVLNLFAGQLYFSSFDDYKLLCSLIGLWDGERELPIRRQVANDNYVSPACRKANGWDECIFKQSPVQVLKAFIGMRRLGIEWSHTHMGRILAGRILQREDFEDAEE